jgi:hypothetical protein
MEWIHGQTSTKPEDELRQRDVCLGGTCGSTTWREDIAVPLLRKHGISSFNPQLADWNTHYIPLEAAHKDNCKILLYVVTADTRGITSMLEAGHYIGQGCNVVLCLQNLKYGIVIDGEKLSANAVKDYNRARSYLADLANRDGIPIFEDISEAVECVIKRFDETDV